MISSLSGCTGTVEHSVDVPVGVTPFVYGQVVCPAVFPTQSTLLWLTVAVYFELTYICLIVI